MEDRLDRNGVGRALAIAFFTFALMLAVYLGLAWLLGGRVRAFESPAFGLGLAVGVAVAALVRGLRGRRRIPS